MTKWFATFSNWPKMKTLRIIHMIPAVWYPEASPWRLAGWGRSPGRRGPPWWGASRHPRAAGARGAPPICAGWASPHTGRRPPCPPWGHPSPRCARTWKQVLDRFKELLVRKPSHFRFKWNYTTDMVHPQVKWLLVFMLYKNPNNKLVKLFSKEVVTQSG